jgi:hypothetical protein
MGAIIAFILTPVGRMVAGAGSVLLLVWSFGVHQQSKGASKERAKIERNADANAKVADRERDAVRELPADRLRDRFTRD